MIKQFNLTLKNGTKISALGAELTQVLRMNKVDPVNLKDCVVVSGTIIKCRECSTDFIFSEGEAEYFKEKEFADPKLCKSCKRKKKKLL